MDDMRYEGGGLKVRKRKCGTYNEWHIKLTDFKIGL